jgi:hypothetical protein
MSERRVMRGGSFADDSRDLRISDRRRVEPESLNWYDGFRLVIRRKR